MLFSILQSVSNFFKLNVVCVDNNVFRLHYKFTAACMITFSVVVTAYQFFGNPVQCVKFGEVRQEVIDTFCWAHATYSMPDYFEKEYGKKVPYPGVSRYDEDETRVFHQYYQWVCFLLLLQAVLFITPHYLWKTWEGGKIKHLILQLNDPILDKDSKEENEAKLARYLKNNLGYHRSYIAVYFSCEVLNFINVVSQMLLTDRFLGHKFSTYGIRILEFTEIDFRKRPDEMTKIFPKMTKCSFNVFGSGGNVVEVDVLCVLPLNMINEKIYIFLWFWFILLATASILILAYRVIILISPHLRYFSLAFRCSRVDRNELQNVLRRCSAGDWFVLNLLAKNLDPNNYRDMISVLCKELTERRINKQLSYSLPPGETVSSALTSPFKNCG